MVKHIVTIESLGHHHTVIFPEGSCNHAIKVVFDWLSDSDVSILLVDVYRMIEAISRIKEQEGSGG